MTRLLIILLAAGLAALSAAWIADHDSVLMLIVGDYEIRTTAAVAIVLLLLCFIGLWAVLRVLFTIVRGLASAHRVAVARKPLPARAPDGPAQPAAENFAAQDRIPS
jgi:uncharacterized membrane-anchored protein